MATTRRTAETPKRATARKTKGVAAADAVRAYQNDPVINFRLMEDTLTDGQRQVVAALDEAMTLLPDMELRRVTVLNNLDNYLKQAQVKEVAQLRGKTVTNTPYMSTTTNDLRPILERRYKNGLSKTAVIIVHTEGKCKGVDVNAALGTQNGFREQNEIILARGQRFLIKRVEVIEDYNEPCPVLHLYAV